MKAHSFSLPDQDGTIRSLADFEGKWLVLYFYPKDETPGCTLEANEFTLLKPDFGKFDAIVVGISADSQESHCSFVENHKLDLILLTDDELAVTQLYGAYGEKEVDGQKMIGVLRSTFLINPQGEIVKEWRKIHADGHAAKVLEALQEFQR